jgi:hypothetical protein
VTTRGRTHPTSAERSIRWNERRLLFAAIPGVLAYTTDEPRRSQFSIVDRRAGNGNRFLLCRPIDPVSPPTITMRFNWAEGLTKEWLVPVHGFLLRLVVFVRASHVVRPCDLHQQSARGRVAGGLYRPIGTDGRELLCDLL